MERRITDAAGVNVEQQLVALTDTAGVPVNPGTGLPSAITALAWTYNNGLMATLTETRADGKARLTTYSYTSGLLTGATIGNWA